MYAQNSQVHIHTHTYTQLIVSRSQPSERGQVRGGERGLGEERGVEAREGRGRDRKGRERKGITLIFFSSRRTENSVK